ncbi:unnamed protein product [Rhizophagus irregularis]|nr:unnamed protein product [Rhizophagus irregularis]CAB5360013.1 unnamed protein product [Rhizophagus irregularis]
MKTDTLAEPAYLLEQIELDKEGESNTNILTGSIFWTKLEGLDSTQYPMLSQPLELSVGAQFSFWEIAEHHIREYGRQKGFVETENKVSKKREKSNEVVKFKREPS